MATIDEIHKANMVLLKKEADGLGSLAAKLERSPSQVSQWVNGSKDSKTGKERGMSNDTCRYIETRMGKPRGWMDIDHSLGAAQELAPYVVQPNNVIPLHSEDAIPPGFVGIKQSKVYFSAGAGYEPEYELIEDSRPAIYSLEWFQEHQINPDKVRRFKVSGDSQEPMLFDGDSVLVHIGETNIIDGKLYAIRYGNDLRVKFLSRRLDGTLILSSLNPRYPAEEVPPSLVEEHITIIGRVRDKSGKGGL